MVMRSKIIKVIIILIMIFNLLPQPFFTILAQSDLDLENMVLNMNQQEKLGQLIMLDFRYWNNGDSKENVLEINSDIENIIKTYKLGGVIIFRENIKDIDQTVSLIDSMQRAVSNNIGLMVSIDQEGGLVSRFKLGCQMPGNMALAATSDPSLVYDVAKVIGNEISALGINTNFAPSVDINTNYLNPIIGVRSFSSDARMVSTMGTAYIEGLHAANIAATAKHFPGHGDTAVDSHLSLPLLNKSYDELVQNELQPFFAAVAAKVDLMMVGHIVVPALDNSDFVLADASVISPPATFSKKILKDLLRDTMKFDGVVITDALDMQAVSNSFSEPEIVVKTLAAGSDIALMPTAIRQSSDTAKLDKIFAAINMAIKDNIISQDQIDASVLRVLKLKRNQNIITYNKDFTLENRKVLAKDVIRSKENRKIEKLAVQKAVTLLKNKDNILPFNLKSKDNILLIASGEKSLNTMISEVELSNGNRMLANISIESIVYADINNLLEKDKQKIAKANYIILETSNLSSNTGFVAQTVLYANSLGSKLVSIASQNPYDLMYIEDIPASLVVYGYLDSFKNQNSLVTKNSNLAAGVETILGNINPSGKLPVSIESLDKKANLYNIGHSLTYTNTLNLRMLKDNLLIAKSYDFQLYTKESFNNLDKTIIIGDNLIIKYKNDEWAVSQKDIDRTNKSLEEAILNLEKVENSQILSFKQVVIISFSLILLLTSLVFIVKVKRKNAKL